MKAAFRTERIALTIALLASAPVVRAQVTAKQGERQFISPMILNLSIEKFLTARKGVGWTTVETRDYTCDGVVLQAVSLVPVKRSDEAVDVFIFVRNDAGRDKEILAKLEVVASEKILSSATVQRFELEEGRSKKKKAQVQLTIPRDAKGDQVPALRIVLSVFDD